MFYFLVLYVVSLNFFVLMIRVLERGVLKFNVILLEYLLVNIIIIKLNEYLLVFF